MVGRFSSSQAWVTRSTRLIGQTISHYRIVDKLGEGGMGVVYKATDTTLNRDVAVKFLPAHLKSDKEAKQRFIREARAASALNHANIAVVHEIDETPEGQVFIVMAYYDGQSLKDKLKDGMLSVNDAITIVSQIASGLAAAHQKGILHRDIKPANILFGNDGHAKLADFGLAKLAGQTKVTKTGTTVGTVAYMSPEQASGDDVDHQSDVFSLGVVMYELLTGRLPFTGDRDAAILYQIVNVNPEPASQYRADLSPDIEAVLGRALAKEREERYASAGDLLDDLHRLQEGRAPATGPAPRRAWLRWVAGAAAGVALTVAVYAAISKFGSSGPGPDEESTTVTRSAVAVLPFTVRGGTDDAGLGEGLVDLLSSKLDGAGSLRSVDPRAILTYIRQQDESLGDLMRSREIAKHFGAGLCIVGDVFQSTDRININAALYESSSATGPLATASVEGEVSSILALVDNLAVQLLKEQLGRDGVTTIDLGSVTTQSYPALKAYLEGESLYRFAGHADLKELTRVKDAYQRAVKLDSTFALAWYRLAQVKMADWAATWVDVDARVAIEQALTYSDGLSEHDQLHLWGLKATIDDDIDEAEQIFQTILGMVPECLDATMGLSRLRHYNGWRRGKPISDGREIAKRAIALDPENGESLYQLYWINVFDGNWVEAEEVLHRMYAEGKIPITEQATLAYGKNDKEGEQEVFEKLKAIPDLDKLNSIFHVAVFTDDLDGARQLARLLTVGEHSDEAKTLGHLILAHIEVASGRWNAAKEELATVATLSPALAIEYKALLAVHPFLEVPVSERKAILDELSGWDASDVPPSTSQLPWVKSHDAFHPLFKTYLTGLLDISLGNYDAEARLAMELEQTPCAPPDTTLGSDLACALRGMSAMRQGKSEEALEEFSKARFQVSFYEQIASLIHFRSLERYLRAELLYEMGRNEEAKSWFDSFAWSVSYEYIYKAPAHLRRAQICERLGQTEQAAEHYSRFIGLWKDCDTALRPTVNEAEARLRNLSGSVER
jgi:tetratricopeptide (TPR) repeat protein